MSLAIAHRQSAIANPEDWVRASDAAETLGCSVRHVVRRAATEWMKEGRAELRPDGKSKPVWWVHREVDSRLTRYPDRVTRDDRARSDLLAEFPEHYIHRAYRRAHWIKVWQVRVAAPRLAGETDASIAAQVVSEAKKHEGDSFKIGVRSLQLWRRKTLRLGNDGKILGVRALVDKYVMTDGLDAPTAARSPLAIDHFHALYRTEARCGITACHEATLAEAKRQGWQWPSSVRATAKWLERYDDRSYTYLCRYGKRAWSHKFMPYNAQDWRMVEPGAFYVCDHHQCDFWVTYKDTQIRPWLTVVQDCRSRRIVGWTLGPAPHQESILAAMRMAFRESIPKVCRIDNGKDFTSKAIVGHTKTELRQLRRVHGPQWKDTVRHGRSMLACDDVRWKGIAAELDVELIFAIPYSAWSKGTVERFFGTLADRWCKSFVTYCGNNPVNRPESLQGLREGRTGRTLKGLELIDTSDIPSFDAARESLGEWLSIYHATPHRGRGVEGATPAAVWASASRLRKVDETALDFLISIRGAYKVGANGVSLSVAGKSISYGSRCPELVRYKGREVLVAVDPDYPARAVAFDAQTRRLIAALQPNEFLDPDLRTDDLREAVAATARGRKEMHRFAREAPQRMHSAAQLANAGRRRRVAELAATGTDNARPNVVAVQTGFEGVSIGPRCGGSSAHASARDFSDFDAIYAGSTSEEDVEEATEPLDDVLLSCERDEADVDVLGEFV